MGKFRRKKETGILPNQTMNSQERQILTKARSSFCNFLTLEFLHLPDQDFVAKIQSPEVRAFLAGLAKDEDVHADIAEGAALMSSFLESNVNTPIDELSNLLGVDRTRLYRGVSPTYGPPPPYESVWNPAVSAANKFLAEIAAVYKADGLSLAEDAYERPDYIGVELAFLENLATKNLKAIKGGEDKKATKLAERQKWFIETHLVSWVPLFIGKALEFAKTDYYRGHLLMLRGFLLDQSEVLASLN
jgi:TorA maturation chaperone TorD